LKSWSDLEAEQPALRVPFQRNFANAHETPWRELNRLTAGEDGLDDIGCQKGELDGATDLAGVVSVTASDLPSRSNFSSGLCLPRNPSAAGDLAFWGLGS